MAKEASAGNDSGRMILTKIWKSVAPSTLGVLDDVARQADHVVAQQIDRERQPEAGMGQPDAQIALADADAQMQAQQRDQRQLQRHHQQADDHGDQQRTAGKAIQASA
jgi:hypothetical protein